jgi:hypothetical protein
MIVHANETRVEAVVKHVAPCGDGYGCELDLEILRNESRDPNADYLRPKAGDRLKVFAAEVGPLKEGSRVRATLGLSGGPFGQRAVLRGAEPAATRS